MAHCNRWFRTDGAPTLRVYVQHPAAEAGDVIDDCSTCALPQDGSSLVTNAGLCGRRTQLQAADATAARLNEDELRDGFLDRCA
jgi:hypothetical protein